MYFTLDLSCKNGWERAEWVRGLNGWEGRGKLCPYGNAACYARSLYVARTSEAMSPTTVGAELASALPAHAKSKPHPSRACLSPIFRTRSRNLAASSFRFIFRSILA